MQNVTDRNDNLDVTIIIVSYNTRDMTVECIQSISETNLFNSLRSNRGG